MILETHECLHDLIHCVASHLTKNVKTDIEGGDADDHPKDANGIISVHFYENFEINQDDDGLENECSVKI